MKKENKTENIKVRVDSLTKVKLLEAAGARGENLSKYLRRIVEVAIDTEHAR